MKLTNEHIPALMEEMVTANELLQQANEELKNSTKKGLTYNEVYREICWQRVKFIREQLEALNIYC